MSNRVILPWLNRDGEECLSCTEFRASPTHRVRLKAILDLIRREFPNPDGVRVLEVGCGTGNIALPIAHAGYSILGIDIDTTSIGIARNRNAFPHAQFEVCPLSDLQGAPYDVVILTEVLEHVPSYRELLSDIRRRLAPRGLLILTVPNGWSLNELACRPSYALKRTRWGKSIVGGIKRLLGARDLTTANEQTPHVNFFTLRALRRLWTESGFHEEAFAGFYVAWPLVEIFARPDALPESVARRDLERSQRWSPCCSSLWAFALRPT